MILWNSLCENFIWDVKLARSTDLGIGQSADISACKVAQEDIRYPRDGGGGKCSYGAEHAGWKASAPQVMQLSFLCLSYSAKQHHILSDLRCQYDVFLFLNRLHSVSIRKLRSDYSISDQPHHCA